ENLRAGLERLPLARALATIKCDVALPVAPTELRRRPPDAERLRALYARLEFKTWLAELGGASPPEAAVAGASPAGRYVAVLDADALDAWLARLAQAPLVALDM